MANFVSVAVVFCKHLLIFNIILSPVTAKTLKFEKDAKKVAPSLRNPLLPPNSVQIKVEELPEISPKRKQEWLIYTITDDGGNVEDVFGMKLDKERGITMSRQMFCRLWRAALLDNIITLDEDRFLLSPNDPSAAEIQQKIEEAKRVPFGQGLLSKWLVLTNRL